MKRKVSQLLGEELDRAAMYALGRVWGKNTHGVHGWACHVDDSTTLEVTRWSTLESWDGKWALPSTPKLSQEWSEGGPVLASEMIDVEHASNNGWLQWVDDERPPGHHDWRAMAPSRNGVETAFGDTPLIAAMRALVRARLGELIEIERSAAGPRPKANTE